MSDWVDAEGVFELGDDDVDGSSGRVTSDKRLRQVRHHKAKLDQTEQNLWT